MPERGIGVIDPETGVKPEDFKFPEESKQKEFPENPLVDTEEFKFHQERFKKQALQTNQKLINRARGKKVTEIDIAHQEALRENADLEKRKDKEFHEWQKHLQVVIEHLKKRRDDPEGEGKKYRPLLLILGGGMRGPYSAAQVIALNEMGLDATKFDTVVGISAGAGTSSYYMAGKEQTYKGTAIFYDECTSKDFLNLMRVRHVMDATVVGKTMREGDKALDQEAIMASPTEFYVAVTRQENKQAELIDVKTAKPGMVSALEASMNVPLLRAPGIEVNGVSYIDGGFDPLPLKEVINKFQPTDILVLPNVPFDRLETFKPSKAEMFLSSNFAEKALPYSGMPGTVLKFLKIAQELRNLLESFKREQNVNVGILWPPDRGLSNQAAEHDTIKGGVYETVRDTFRQLGEKEPEKIELYESPK